MRSCIVHEDGGEDNLEDDVESQKFFECHFSCLSYGFLLYYEVNYFYASGAAGESRRTSLV